VFQKNGALPIPALVAVMKKVEDSDPVSKLVKEEMAKLVA